MTTAKAPAYFDGALLKPDDLQGDQAYLIGRRRLRLDAARVVQTKPVAGGRRSNAARARATRFVTEAGQVLPAKKLTTKPVLKKRTSVKPLGRNPGKNIAVG